MSGALAEVPLAARGIDPWEGYKNYYGAIAAQYAPAQAAATVGNTQAEAELRRATVPKTQAEAGLIGQQTTAAGITNQIQLSRLGLLNGTAGSAPPPGALPWDTSASSYSGGQPAAAGGGGAPVGIYGSTSSAGGGGPLIGGSGHGSGGGGGASYAGPDFTGSQGVMVPGFGAMPSWAYAGTIQAQDQAKAWEQVRADKNMAIQQLVASTRTGPNGEVNPDLFNQAVQTAFNRGLITNREAQQWYDHKGLATAWARSTLPGDKQPEYLQEVASREAYGRVRPLAIGAQAAPYNISPTETRVNPPLPGEGGGAGGAGGGSGPAGNGMMERLPPDKASMVQRVAAATGMPPEVLAGHTYNESAGSMAPPSGDGGASHGVMQMQGPTLDDYNAKHGSHWTVDQLKKNPEIGMQVGADHWLDLKNQFNGDPVSASMAFQWGAGAVQRWRQAGADPSRVPATVRDNIDAIYGPGAVNSVRSRLPGGGAPAAAGGGPAPAPGAAAGGTESVLQSVEAGGAGQPGPAVPAVRPMAGGGTTVGPAMSPQGLSLQQEAGRVPPKQVADYQNEMLTKGQAAQTMNALIDQARLESNSWTSGRFADHKMQALSVLDTLRQNLNSLVGKEVFGKPDESVGDWTAFNKNMMNLVRTAVRETSSRAAVQEFNMIRVAQPQDESSPQAVRQLFDELQGLNDWVQAKSGAAGGLPLNVAPNKFDNDWNQNVTPAAFIIHRMNTPDFQNLAQRVSQSAEGRQWLKDMRAQMIALDHHGYFANLQPGLPVGRQPAAQ